MLRHTVLIGLLLSLQTRAFEYPILPLADLKKETQRTCTFVHLWAAWCSICVQEMPKLLSFLEEEKKIYPVILDTDVRFAQDNFSTPWLKKLAPKFTVYRKPEVENAVLAKTLGITWSKSLPLSALYSHGKIKREWRGSLSTEELHKAFQELCPAR